MTDPRFRVLPIRPGLRVTYSPYSKLLIAIDDSKLRITIKDILYPKTVHRRRWND